MTKLLLAAGALNMLLAGITSIAAIYHHTDAFDRAIPTLASFGLGFFVFAFLSAVNDKYKNGD